MLIRFNISKYFSSPFISINTQQKNDDLLFMATAIGKIVNQEAVTGYQNEKRKVIPLYQIISVHTESKKVLCETKNGTYYIQKRIYEMKEILPQKLFIQLSNSEIVNVTQIKAFSLSSTGSYQVDLSNGRRTYTSRRYAQIIRKELLK